MSDGARRSVGRRPVAIVVSAGVLVIALVVALVVAFPAWSARRGADAVWVIENALGPPSLTTRTLLDYDDDRLLLVGGRNALTVRDRGSGEELSGTSSARTDPIAALVPSGLVHSDRNRLEVVDDDGSRRWEVQTGADDVREVTLVAVDVEAGHVVAAVRGMERDAPERLVAYALDDGDVQWELPDIGRTGFTQLGELPDGPPGALRHVRVYPVVFRGAGERWNVIDTRTGDVVEEIDTEGVPVYAGEFVIDGRGACAEIHLSRMGQEVPLAWPDGAPGDTCHLARSVSPERMFLTAPVPSETEDRVRLFHLDPASGDITELDWEGPREDVDPGGSVLGPADASRSWGPSFYGGEGTMYDARTGAVAWDWDDDAYGAWSAGDTAVVTRPLSWADRFATDGTDTSLWYEVVDAVTGQLRGGRFIGLWPAIDVAVLDRGQVLILSGDQIALLE